MTISTKVNQHIIASLSRISTTNCWNRLDIALCPTPSSDQLAGAGSLGTAAVFVSANISKVDDAICGTRTGPAEDRRYRAKFTEGGSLPCFRQLLEISRDE